MTADRQTNAWAGKYLTLLQGYVALLGGDDITPTRRALAETISTLQCELSMLTDRFASNGRGASADDLNLYLKLSSNVSEMLQGAGLQQTVTDQNHSGDAARDKLASTIHGLIRAREQEEAMGVFRNADGSVIVDPMRIELEKQILALKARRDHLHDVPAPLMLSPPSAPTPAPPSASTPTPTAKARAVTPEEARAKAMQPSFPTPPAPTPDSTAEWYRWQASGGGERITDWSPGPNWRGW